MNFTNDLHNTASLPIGAAQTAPIFTTPIVRAQPLGLHLPPYATNVQAPSGPATQPSIFGFNSANPNRLHINVR